MTKRTMTRKRIKISLRQHMSMPREAEIEIGEET